jgi:hypothetical protein
MDGVVLERVWALSIMAMINTTTSTVPTLSVLSGDLCVG